MAQLPGFWLDVPDLPGAGFRGAETQVPSTLHPGCSSLPFSFPVSGGARLPWETQMEPVKFSTATESVLLLQMGKQGGPSPPSVGPSV